MKLDYEYSVQSIDSQGMATVEYRHKDYGWVIRMFFLPYDLGEEAIRQKIIEKFPQEIFYGRWLSRQNLNEKLTAAYVRGKITTDFNDHFYHMQLNVAELYNEKENH